jgi:hypothetical protein
MIRRLLPFWVWGAIAFAFMLITIGISIGFTIYWVRQGLANECQALNYVIDHGRIPSPVFMNALQHWAHGDGCR